MMGQIKNMFNENWVQSHGNADNCFGILASLAGMDGKCIEISKLVEGWAEIAQSSAAQNQCSSESADPTKLGHHLYDLLEMSWLGGITDATEASFSLQLL